MPSMTETVNPAILGFFLGLAVGTFASGIATMLYRADAQFRRDKSDYWFARAMRAEKDGV